MTYQSIIYKKRDAVAYITLNRPEDANALDLSMAKELHEVALDCERDDSVRAVLITGNGRMFCGASIATIGIMRNGNARTAETKGGSAIFAWTAVQLGHSHVGSYAHRSSAPPKPTNKIKGKNARKTSIVIHDKSNAYNTFYRDKMINNLEILF